MECSGVYAVALNWIKSYFSYSTQRLKVRINERYIRSDPQQLRLGIPQGSIAGPLFFLIYYVQQTLEHISIGSEEFKISPCSKFSGVCVDENRN